MNLGPASFISTTFENIDPKTNKTIPGSSSNSTGIGLFETSAKAGLGFKAELKASLTIGMGGEIRPVKPLGIAPSDATSTANRNVNSQPITRK